MVTSHNKYERVFRIMEYLASRHGGASLSEVAAAAEIPVSSCHGVLQGMCAVHAATVTSSRKYILGRRSRALAAILADTEHVVPLCRREFAALVDEFGFDLYLARRTGDGVIYVERGYGTHPVNVNIPLGTPLALHATAVGKLYCAYVADVAEPLLQGCDPLERLTESTIVDRDRLRAEFVSIREQGFSVSVGEGIQGITGIAVPVLNQAGVIQAAIHMSTLSEAFSAEVISRAITALTHAAGRVSVQLG
jgi:IclR family acetate operon transcriptional repressor